VDASRPERGEERLGRRGGVRELLRAPALLFGALVGARGAAYASGLARAHDAGLPVLSVGNLTVGGTGKTPFCIWVVRELQRLGRKPGLLSRGYRAGADGRNEEALVFGGACPGVPHVQDPDRVRGARVLRARGVDTIVLDDGFQHRRLAREQDWVLIDALRPWGLPRDARGESVRALLPRGLLREPLSALARADALVITRANDVHPSGSRRSRPSSAPRRRASRSCSPRTGPRASSTRAAASTRWRSSKACRSSPSRASATRRPSRARCARSAPASDGTTPSPTTTTTSPRTRARSPPPRGSGGRRLVTTTKDAVKLAPLGLDFLVLEIELELVRGAAQARALLESLPRGSA
jgi:tetraacyldisaccharide-1-P 4'-kinase